MTGRRPLSAVVLAAGEGTRMRSSRPKPLHLMCGRPMLLHVLDALTEVPVDRVVVVVAPADSMHSTTDRGAAVATSAPIRSIRRCLGALTPHACTEGATQRA